VFPIPAALPTPILAASPTSPPPLAAAAAPLIAFEMDEEMACR
jgi:hypothetical protein